MGSRTGETFLRHYPGKCRKSRTRKTFLRRHPGKRRKVRMGVKDLTKLCGETQGITYGSKFSAQASGETQESPDRCEDDRYCGGASTRRMQEAGLKGSASHLYDIYNHLRDQVPVDLPSNPSAQLVIVKQFLSAGMTRSSV